MYLNVIKAYDGYTNEVTNILSFMTGKRIVMNKNRVMHVAYTEERVGEIHVSLTGKVTKIELEQEYEEYLMDISFLFRADYLMHGDSTDKSMECTGAYEKFGDYLVMRDQDYVELAKAGMIPSLLEKFAAHGVMIQQKQEISVCYDYGTADRFFEGKVTFFDGVITLTPTNTKPTTSHVKKFPIKNGYLCVLDLAYVENVGLIFATVQNEDVCVHLLNAQNRSSREQSSTAGSKGLGKLTLFGR